MKRILLLVGAIVITSLGCHTLRHTAGICDCNPPPVSSLLREPTLPPYECQGPQQGGPYEPAAPRMRAATEPPTVIVTPPKVIEGGKR